MPNHRQQGSPKKFWWEQLPSKELLEVRLCDLGLRIGESLLEPRRARLYEELARHGMRFRPYIWLSTDWFTPSGVTGFAVPFYLAHRRLMRLELSNMFEVEGGEQESCMMLMRHETAHAIDYAYRLHRRKRWREVFGPFSTPYRTSYSADPESRRHVVHLNFWYSQSHPSEDFAETVAVWLRPGSRWRKRFAGWPALAKVEYVGALMAEIAEKTPPVRTRRREDPIEELDITLGKYYKRKKAAYQVDLPSTYDEPLLRIFCQNPRSRRQTAASFLRGLRAELRRHVGNITGLSQYLVDQVILELIPRCRKLDLRLCASERRSLMDISILLAFLSTHLQNDRRRGYYR